MALSRKFLTKTTPDRLVEISDRIYVFDCCFSTDSMDEDEYQDYLSDILEQLQDFFPDASFMVSNFWSGNKRTRISQILSRVTVYDMTIMDYPQQFEGRPLLELETIHHFLKSCENWLSMEGQHNMLLMHCERGGWPVLAFMLAGLLLYRKTYTNEHATLHMVYEQASRDFIQQFFPLNPRPSHLRYLHYISRQIKGWERQPVSQTLVLDSVMLCGVPSFDAREGSRQYLRVHGHGLSPGNKSAKVFFEIPKTKKHLRRCGQEEYLKKITAGCRVQGDVVLECIHTGNNLEHEDTIFRVMFNTAFIESNKLVLNREGIDVPWNVYDQFPTDFRAELLFSEPDWFKIAFDTVSVDRHDGFYKTEKYRHDDLGPMQREAPMSSGAQKQTFAPLPSPPRSSRSGIGGNTPPPLPSLNNNMVTPLPLPPPPLPPPPSLKETPKMDGESSRHDNLEVVLQDQSAKPCDLRLHYLMYITDNFSDKQKLGRGGFGVVYKGTLPNGAMIAVKGLVSKTEVQDEQFKNEVDNLMRVRHQNIVRFVGYCYETRKKHIEYNGKYIFAETPQMLLCFEYMPNGSLDRYITEESHGLDWEKRYEIIKGICCGLKYLHEECLINGSIIHLDLKPANILLDVNMVPKIADFGVSRLFNDQKTRTYTTDPKGTFSYMAPEYLYQGTITTKADIYSLGVIIIEVVSGFKIIPYAAGNFCIDFELVFRNWRNRLEASPSCTYLEKYCKQIKVCVEIGKSCVKVDPRERPSIREIIERLDK